MLKKVDYQSLGENILADENSLENWSRIILKGIPKEDLIAMGKIRCSSKHMRTGKQCEKEAGHEGSHVASNPPSPFKLVWR